MAEEQQKLKDKEIELINTKKKTVHLNFCKLVLLKKQSELNKIIEKVKKETGIDNLDKLSSDLQLSTKTNSLFENDLVNLEKQKKELEDNIEIKKKEIKNAYNILNDTSTKKNEYMEKLEKELKDEEAKKDLLNRRLYSLNKMIELMSKGFKNICEKLNFFDKDLKFESESPEGILTKCMDFLERKMTEIIQLNTDPLKETIATDNDETKQMLMIKKISDTMNKEEHSKMIDKKKIVFKIPEIMDIIEENGLDYNWHSRLENFKASLMKNSNIDEIKNYDFSEISPSNRKKNFKKKQSTILSENNFESSLPEHFFEVVYSVKKLGGLPYYIVYLSEKINYDTFKIQIDNKKGEYNEKYISKDNTVIQNPIKFNSSKNIKTNSFISSRLNNNREVNADNYEINSIKRMFVSS